MSIELKTVEGCDREHLHAFLERVYSQSKASQLNAHGSWLYRGDNNRFVLVDGEDILGYCGVIPVRVRIGNRVHDAVWWVDLIVDPRYRGKGLQTRFDERIRQITDLKLGFPNTIAAKIHRKHRWGVREGGKTLLAPLRPMQLKSIIQSSGSKRLFKRFAAVTITPIVLIARNRILQEKTESVFSWEKPDVEVAAEIFRKSQPNSSITTMRDQEYLRWRYFEAPSTHELKWYRYESQNSNEVIIVTRTVDLGEIAVTRVLDIFGDIHNIAAIRLVLTSIYQDAVRNGSTQVTMMATLPHLQQAAKQCGFIISTISRFCWHTESALMMETFRSQPVHWVLGDSDNDEPA